MANFDGPQPIPTLFGCLQTYMCFCSYHNMQAIKITMKIIVQLPVDIPLREHGSKFYLFIRLINSCKILNHLKIKRPISCFESYWLLLDSSTETANNRATNRKIKLYYTRTSSISPHANIFHFVTIIHVGPPSVSDVT